MKVLYIESKIKDFDINISNEEIKKLPKTLFLAYSIQYLEKAKLIKKILEKNNIKIIGFEQVLGCSKINAKYPILLIGTGRFHALNMISQSVRLYILENNNIIEIPKKDLETLKIRKKTALIKFLSGNNIGILVSSKPGQENLELSLKLKRNLEKKGKNAYIFLSNNINTNEFENFNIDSWINTACFGLSNDDPNIINFNDIPKL